MASRRNGTLHIDVTSNLVQRLLLWFGGTMESGILPEKPIKGGSRAAKLALIEGRNPDWRDLYEAIA